MDLLEHQGKRLFAEFGLPVLASACVAQADAAGEAAERIGPPVAVKAQVKTGGRGKAGGVRVCESAAEAARAAGEILGMTIKGHHVREVLVEQAVPVTRELYLAVTLSRPHGGPLLIFAREGGIDIEQAAREDPDSLVRQPVDPFLGVCDYQVRDVLKAAGLPADAADPDGRPAAQQLAAVVRALWRLYHDADATLAEINPLALTADGRIVCLDSKVTVDDSALFRQDGRVGGQPDDEGERRAKAAGLAYVPLDGDIGVLGNGAGLVMSTLDQIAAAGGSAADFCDLGGGARADVVSAALDVVLSAGTVSSLLVTVFGGITRCDEVARGLVDVFGQRPVAVPVVVRLDGNASDEGRRVLAEARLPGVTVAADAAEAVRLAVSAAAAGDGGGS